VPDTVGITNALGRKLENALCHIAGMTKRIRKTNFRRIISTGRSGFNHAPFIHYRLIPREEISYRYWDKVPVFSLALKDKCNKFTFYAANGMPITMYGQKFLQLNFRPRRNF